MTSYNKNSKFTALKFIKLLARKNNNTEVSEEVIEEIESTRKG